MLLGHHPFQRSGAWAAALLSDRTHPHEVTAGDLEDLVARIAADCDRAGRLAKGDPGWAWLVRLAGMYPQSPPVHPSRHKHDKPIAARVAAFLGPDPDPGEVLARGERVWACWTCQREGASIRWAKDKLPLSDSARHLNNSPYGGGYPLCQTCRIALWALPYATAAAGRYHQNLSSSSAETERALCAAHLEINERAQAEEWTSWRQGPHADDLLWDTLTEHRIERDVEILCWTHGNRESELRIAHLSPLHTRVLATAHRGADELRRAARTVASHPLQLTADAEQLEDALHTAPRWAADVLSTRLAEPLTAARAALTPAPAAPNRQEMPG